MTYHQTIMEHEAMALQKGMEKGVAQAKLETLTAMMKNLKLSAEDAMAASDIPKEDYAKYKNLLQAV